MLTRRFAVALTLLTCLAVAGCAGNNGSPSAGSATSAPATSSSPSLSPSLGPSLEPSAGGPETVTGTVEAGVEANCRVIKDSAGTYSLYFDDPSLKSQATVGKTVTVTGHSKAGMMTTCQQGTPFVVTSVSPG